MEQRNKTEQRYLTDLADLNEDYALEVLQIMVKEVINSMPMIFGLLKMKPDFQKFVDRIPQIIFLLSRSEEGRVMLQEMGVYEFIKNRNQKRG